MAEMEGDVFKEDEAELVAGTVEELELVTELGEVLLLLSFGEERLGSVRLGEGSASEIGEELVKG